MSTKDEIIMPEVYPVACHTDHVGPNSIFVAIAGTKQDGGSYIPLALEKGARHIVVATGTVLESTIYELIRNAGVRLTFTDNTRSYLALQAAHECGYPAHKLKIIAVTGTKGKTTTCFLIEHILKTAGFVTALMTTVTNRIGNNIFESSLTTAQPDYMHVFLKLCVELGVEYVVMEVSAQALSFNRLEGIYFDGIVFTNFKQDHLDYYKTMDNYFSAKVQLLSHRKPGAPVCVNADDERLHSFVSAHDFMCTYGYSRQNMKISAQLMGDPKISIQLRISYQHVFFSVVSASLIGRFNAYNCLAASSLALQLGVGSQHIQKAIQSFDKVPGRFEVYMLPNGARAIVDYAHNPSSCEEILSLLGQMTDKLIVVMGAGGDRDRTKRPLMGAIAAHYGNLFIATSDNPRSENPEHIIDDILAGIGPEFLLHVIREPDRESAIKKAYTYSSKESIIAILGRGNEEYQIIGAIKRPLSDGKIVQSLR